MKLIIEEIKDAQFITEANSDGTKSMFINGVFMQSNVKNRNGRIYPESIMDAACNKYITEKVNCGKGYGELGHPSGPGINLDRTAILIKSLQKEGTNWIGKAKVTSTPMGQIVRGLLEDGANLGVSSRGLGTLKANKDGIMEVQNDYQLCTAADVVSDPSAPQAYVKGIMEGAEWIYDPVHGTYIEEHIHQTRKKIHRMTKEEREHRQLTLFKEHLDLLAKITK